MHRSNQSSYQFCFVDICGFSENAKWVIEPLEKEAIIYSLLVNPTVDHPGMCPWHNIARFRSLFHFQSSQPQGFSMCFIFTSVFFFMWLILFLILECVTGMHDKEPLNMISNVLASHVVCHWLWPIQSSSSAIDMFQWQQSKTLQRNEESCALVCLWIWLQANN